MTSVLWLRRDLRLRDHPALHEAAGDGPVVALFVLDLAEHSGVDGEVPLAVVQTHAGVRELGQLHQMSRSSSTTWTAASSALAA